MLLALNTCGATGSVALGRVEASRPSMEPLEILAQAKLTGRAFSAQLIPKIGEMLATVHATISDIEAVVAVRGPGSFTGIRVGLSSAKGLAEAAKIPLIALSRLALLASVSGLPHVLAAIDAGRGEYYVGEYRDGKNLGEKLLSGAEVCAAAQRPGAGVLVCEGAEAGDAIAPCLPLGLPLALPTPDAADALRLALDRFLAGDFEDVETLDANYLRRSDVELFGAADRER